jgi:hypothetical protein
MATAFVTAAAALYMQAYPNASAKNIAAAIVLSASYHGASDDNPPMLDIDAMMGVLPTAELPTDTLEINPFPDGFRLRDYVEPFEELPFDIQALLTSGIHYSSLSAEERDLLRYYIGLREDTMSECGTDDYSMLADYSSYENYLLDKISWNYAVKSTLLFAYMYDNRLQASKALRYIQEYQQSTRMYFDNVFHESASTYYKWNKYTVAQRQVYGDGDWSVWSSSTHTTASFSGYTTRSFDKYYGYHLSGSKTVSNFVPGSILQGTASQITEINVDQSGYKKTRTKTRYNAGTETGQGTYVTEVTSNTSNTYPSDGQSGNYWYVSAGTGQTAVPTITLSTISDVTTGAPVTVYATSSTPCYRMAAKYTVSSVDTWLPTVYSGTYNQSTQSGDLPHVL